MEDQPARGFLDCCDDGPGRVRAALLGELRRIGTGPSVPLFFRADDIGVLSSSFLRLLRLFLDYQVPLSLALVPAWLSSARWRALRAEIDTRSPLWCWHQHGWTHTNHQPSGKKAEFGPARPAEAIQSDLARGMSRLEAVIGSSFYPVFTPPWNRCTAQTVEILAELGCRAVSRSRGEQKQPVSLPDYYINVDLHTRKEPDPAAALDNLCSELRRAAAAGRIGIMIHHQLMDENHFSQLEALLELAAIDHRLAPCNFAAMGGMGRP